MSERVTFIRTGDRVRTNRNLEVEKITLHAGHIGLVTALDPKYGVWVMFENIRVQREGKWVPLVARFPAYAVDKMNTDESPTVSDR